MGLPERRRQSKHTYPTPVVSLYLPVSSGLSLAKFAGMEALITHFRTASEGVTP